MKSLIIIIILCAGAYFAWKFTEGKPMLTMTQVEPKQEQAAPAPTPAPAKSPADLAKEREEAEKKKAEEAAAQLKAEAEKQAKSIEGMKAELTAKKEEWRKLKDERKKYSTALKEADDKGWSNIDIIPDRQQECKAAFTRFQAARKKFADVKDKIEDAEKAVKRAASETNSFAKSTNEMVGWKYVGDSYVHPMRDLPNRDKKRPIKYIEGKGMSAKQSAEVNEKKHGLNAAIDAAKSVKSALDSAEAAHKAAGEKYENEVKGKIKEYREKMNGIVEAGKVIEAKLTEAGEGKANDEKDDDEG